MSIPWIKLKKKNKTLILLKKEYLFNRSLNGYELYILLSDNTLHYLLSGVLDVAFPLSWNIHVFLNMHILLNTLTRRICTEQLGECIWVPICIQTTSPNDDKCNNFWKTSFLFTSFGCAGSLLWCGLFSHWGARSLGHAGFSRLDSWALEHGLRACGPWA